MTGLAGWWRLNETSGTAARDASDHGNTGTLVNIASPATATSGWNTAGKFNGAMAFDGSDDNVDVGNGTSLAISYTFTVAAWIYPLSVTGSYLIYSRTGGPSADRTPYFGILNGVLAAIIGDGTSYQNINSGVVIQVNQWQHVVFYFNGTKTGYYRNGINIYEINQTVFPVNRRGSFNIGSFAPGVYRCFNGLIDDVRVYNRTLTADDVLALYNNGGPSVIRNAVIRNAVLK